MRRPTRVRDGLVRTHQKPVPAQTISVLTAEIAAPLNTAIDLTHGFDLLVKGLETTPATEAAQPVLALAQLIFSQLVEAKRALAALMEASRNGANCHRE
jgi:hypothetical protein